MQDFSDDMVDDLFSEDGSDAVILVKLEADGLAAPFLASSDEAGTDSTFGVDGGPVLHFPFFPFALTFGGAGLDEPSRDVTLEIANSDGRIVEAIRTATGKPLVTVCAVRPASPNAVEIELQGVPISSAQATDPKVSATLHPRTFSDEPAVSPRYTLKRTPSLA